MQKNIRQCFDQLMICQYEYSDGIDDIREACVILFSDMGVAANLKSTDFTYLDFAKTDDTCYVSFLINGISSIRISYDSKNQDSPFIINSIASNHTKAPETFLNLFNSLPINSKFFDILVDENLKFEGLQVHHLLSFDNVLTLNYNPDVKIHNDLQIIHHYNQHFQKTICFKYHEKDDVFILDLPSIFYKSDKNFDMAFYNFLKLYIKQNTFMPIFHEFPDFYSIYNNHKVFESLCVDFYNDYISQKPLIPDKILVLSMSTI